jgi:ABC-type sugar transport system ATPase subunit
VFLFDEPLSNLDAVAGPDAARSWKAPRDLRATMIYVTRGQVEAALSAGSRWTEA